MHNLYWWFDSQDGTLLAMAESESSPAASSPDGTLYVAAVKDTQLNRSVLKAGDPSKNRKNAVTLQSPDSNLYHYTSLSVSTNGRVTALIYGNDYSEVEIWDAVKVILLGSLKPEGSDSSGRVAISPDGNTLVMVKYKNYQQIGLALYDISNPQKPGEIKTLTQKEIYPDSPRLETCSLTFSPDGKWLAIGYSNGSILLLSTTDWSSKNRVTRAFWWREQSALFTRWKNTDFIKQGWHFRGMGRQQFYRNCNPVPRLSLRQVRQ